MMQKMIEEGRLGRKGGRGFYDVSVLVYHDPAASADVALICVFF